MGGFRIFLAKLKIGEVGHFGVPRQPFSGLSHHFLIFCLKLGLKHIKMTGLIF